MAVSENDEYPRQSLFVLKNVFSQSDLNITKDEKGLAILSLNYLKNNVKTIGKFEVSIDHIAIRK